MKLSQSFLHSIVYTHIMTGMESTSTQPHVASLTRFLVPIAAVLVFAVWFSFTPPGLLGKADAVGYAICHRIGERSFHIGDRQLPLCARCTGEFFSAAIALFFFAIVSPKKSGMRIALASILYPAFNQSVWVNSLRERALDWKKLGILVSIVFVTNLAMITENPIVLYPIAFLSVFGVLALLIIVFTLIWLLVMRQENAFTSLRELWMPFLAGTTLALLMITAIDLLRFKLTGTWGGFPLG